MTDQELLEDAARALLEAEGCLVDAAWMLELHASLRRWLVPARATVWGPAVLNTFRDPRMYVLRESADYEPEWLKEKTT